MRTQKPPAPCGTPYRASSNEPVTTTRWGDAMPIPGYTIDTIDQFVGAELGVSDWLTVDQARIN